MEKGYKLFLIFLLFPRATPSLNAEWSALDLMSLKGPALVMKNITNSQIMDTMKVAVEEVEETK